MSLPTINELSKEIANLISAGEVVERPSSVVKELVENAIDANATVIKVDLINSGIKKITVLDNGYGMSKDQIPVAVKPHATSKIKTSEDLFNIATLGFRGEALPSIQSVSKMRITSSVDGISGYYYQYKSNDLIDEGVISMPKGTKVEVENLFFNTPARLKHLSTESVELSHITTLINRLAVANPKIAFTLINNGKIVYQTDGLNDVISLIGQTYGIEVAKNLIKFENKNDLYHIKGYSTNNNVYRSNKNYINIIINNRIIRNLNILFAVTDAYKSIIPVGKYPITILEIECDPSLIDVNVHPTKLEIRFTDELILRELITSTIGKALYQTTLIYNADDKDIKTPTELITHTEPVVETPVLKEENINSLWDLFEDGDSDSSQDNDDDYEDDEDDDDQEEDIDEEIYQEDIVTKPSVTVQTIDLEQSIFDKLRYIGQYRKTYLLFDGGDDLYLIDQHAAMERWMYEKIKLSFEAPSNKSIELLIPITLEFGVAEIPLINEKSEELKRLGIVFEPFGRTTIVVREIPLWIPKNLEIEFISDIINHLINNQLVSKAVMYESLAKQLSCKKSIKANSSILDIEVNELLQNLKSCKMPYTCPHGRPTLVKISTYEIEKMFKRVI
ncbi:MAG: DNA mismatch repair endonuclease MutL [Bacilli bacterium]|nr:DNA mismatch repair endonuclease MutL [Bacilli bacterium]